MSALIEAPVSLVKPKRIDRGLVKVLLDRNPIDLSVPVTRSPSMKRYAPPPLAEVSVPVPIVPAYCVVVVSVPLVHVGEVPDAKAQPVGNADVWAFAMPVKSCV